MGGDPLSDEAARSFVVGEAPISSQRTGSYPSQAFVQGGGVAIFHVASARVVVCFHSREKHWFLPKGRRDVGESVEVAACREGFEESGYRNRLLPLPIATRQPKPVFASAGAGEDGRAVRDDFVTEPVYLELLPFKRQYLLTWYIAETVPPEIEAELNAKDKHTDQRAPYAAPPLFPKTLRLIDRLAAEPQGYEPVRHEGMGVDSDEACYESYLLPIEEACDKLDFHVMKHVVRIGWGAILERLTWERGQKDG